VSVDLAWDTEAPVGISEEALVEAGAAALQHGELSEMTIQLVMVSDEALAELHGRFLDDDSPTDVMAFDMSDEVDGRNGEVYVSVDCARRVSAQRGTSFDRELALYVVHGCLHLCGYDDHEDEDRARMREAEHDVLSRLGYPRDDMPHEL
jgi:probable rRNA maturation factor